MNRFSRKADSNDVKIVNVVATGQLKLVEQKDKSKKILLMQKLDLLYIARHSWNVQYDPSRFSAAIFRRRQSSSREQISSSSSSSLSTSTTILLFKSGKFVCTGAKSTAEAKVASRRFARSIQKILCRNDEITKRRELRLSGFTVQNVVGSFYAGFRVDLTELYAGRSKQCLWQQELFPAGIRYRPPSSGGDGNNSCALIFHSGRCVITGCRREEDVRELGAEVYRLLLRYKLYTAHIQILHCK